MLSDNNSANEGTGVVGFSPSAPLSEMKRIILFVAGGNESKPVFAGGGVVATVACCSRMVERFRKTSSERTRSTPSGVANHDPTLTTMSSETLRGEGERITRTRFQGQTTYRYRLRQFEHCDDHSTATVHSKPTTTQTTPSTKRT